MTPTPYAAAIRSTRNRRRTNPFKWHYAAAAMGAVSGAILVWLATR